MIEKIAGIVFIGFVVFVFYLFFIVMPTSIYAEAKCLAKGYPKAYTTIGLEIYCGGLNGDVFTEVKKLND